MNPLFIAVLIAAVFAIAGFSLLGACFCRERAMEKKLERCSKLASGTVSRIIDYRVRMNHISTMWHSFYTFTVDDQRIEKRGSFGTEKPLFQEGQKVSILYNPENPEEFLVQQEWEHHSCQLLLMIGIGFICISVATVITLTKIIF